MSEVAPQAMYPPAESTPQAMYPPAESTPQAMYPPAESTHPTESTQPLAPPPQSQDQEPPPEYPGPPLSGPQPPPPGPPPAYDDYPPTQHASYQQAQYTMYPQPATAINVISTPTKFPEAPVTLECPHCHTQVTTTTNTKIGLMSWLIVGGVCLGGCLMPLVWLGCCFIPLCIKGLKDVVHTCPNCDKQVGTYRRLS